MRKSSLWFLALGGALVLVPAVPPAGAQGTIPDAPQLTDINPPSVQRGNAVDVVLSGQRLTGTKQLLLRYSAYPNFIKPTERGLKAENVTAASDGQVKAKLTVPADAPPGLHEVRAVTDQGVTGAAYFYVSQYPQAPEKEPNNAVPQGNPVKLPVVVAGTVNGGEDRDAYTFDAKAGETVVFDVEGFKRFAPPLNNQEGITYLDSFISLHDASGRELAYSDDDTRLDAFLAYKFPADGKYTIVLRDNQYRGRGDFHYRMTIAKRPTVTAIFPPGGQKGSRAVITVFGYNLDASGATQVRRSVTLSQQEGVYEYSLSTPDGVSNSVPIVSDAIAESPEVEPNDRVQDGTQVVVPATCSGKFDSLEDVDGFRFQGQAGQVLVLEMNASRLGSPVDAAITLRTRSGQVIGTNDDASGVDPRLEVTLPRTDEYVVFIRNQTKSGAGPQQFYRLAVRPRAPGFRGEARREGINRQGGRVMLPVDSVAVQPGGEMEFEVFVARQEGQDGDIQVTLNLPPEAKGLKLEELIKTPIQGQIVNGQQQFKVTVSPNPPVIKNGKNSIPVKITAPENMAPGAYLAGYLKLSGTAGARPLVVNQPLWIVVSPK